jgi:molecular chaperone GrpE
LSLVFTAAIFIRHNNNSKGNPSDMMPKDNDDLNNDEIKPGTPEVEKAPETSELEQSFAAEKKRADECLAKWQRAQADFINYKRRNEQERLEFSKFASSSAFLAMLPVLDDLERALAAIPPDYAGQKWVEGVRLVERKFKSGLELQGVKPVLALGMAFDPNFHEAVRQAKGPEGTVLQEFQRGYTLNGKLLRPAKVVVGNGEEDKPEPEKE